MRPEGDLDAPDVSGARAPEGSGTARSPGSSAPVEPWPELLSEGASREAETAALPDPHVAEILQEVRSGVRQRAAEAETAGTAESDAVRQGLLALRQREFVAEPVPFSHRASLGRAIVFVRKAVYHLFLKWHARPVLEQQNGFNQAASRLIQELVEAAERSERERRELAGRVAELERRASVGAEERRE
jgi:hypothetical protein